MSDEHDREAHKGLKRSNKGLKGESEDLFPFPNINAPKLRLNFAQVPSN